MNSSSTESSEITENKTDDEKDEYLGYPPVITNKYGDKQVLTGQLIHWLFETYNKLEDETKFVFAAFIHFISNEVRLKFKRSKVQFSEMCSAAMSLYCTITNQYTWRIVSFETYMDKDVAEILKSVDLQPLTNVLCWVCLALEIRLISPPFNFPDYGQSDDTTCVAIYIVLNNLYCDFCDKDFFSSMVEFAYRARLKEREAHEKEKEKVVLEEVHEKEKEEV
jgi:hypothetical protein